MNRDTPTNGGGGQNPTASTQTNSTRITIGPDTRPELSTHEFHGPTIFTTHGVADGASTIYATSVLGISTEANPLVTQHLQQGWGWAAGTMLLVTGLVAVVYPSIAQLDVIPSWFGPTLTTIGLLIAITNVLVGVSA